MYGKPNCYYYSIVTILIYNQMQVTKTFSKLAVFWYATRFNFHTRHIIPHIGNNYMAKENLR